MHKFAVLAFAVTLAAVPAMAQQAPDPSVLALDQMAAEGWHREAASLLRAYRAEALVRELQAQVTNLQAQIKAGCDASVPAKP